MKRKIFIITMLIEITVILFLAIMIYFTSKNALEEKVSINPIPKDTVNFPKDSKLKYFYEPKPNITINHKPDWLPNSYDYTITINADSLNERFDYSTDKPQDVFRIITLGDSRTYGLYVNTKENYPERLEELLNKELKCQNIEKFEVINLGVGGYDIEYSVQRFQIRGQKYNSDLVLWFLLNNDFTDINEILQPKINQYRKEMQADKTLIKNLHEVGEFFPWTVKARQELAEEFKDLGGLEYQKAALHKINDYYKGRLVFITHSELKDSHMPLLQDFTKIRRGTSIYDGLRVDYDHFTDGHPNSKGYEQIANGIFDYFKSNNLIPCN